MLGCQGFSDFTNLLTKIYNHITQSTNKTDNMHNPIGRWRVHKVCNLK
ncbi:hypothetical protein CLOSTASPAR_00030 [[Clostridium] asparagiforme DSM 15981]|uniref:Uncharacterized protein n=1 Tax=[Clostridium] asparagiforme DSM 15981 TaxID=518636 RepID=C0CST6_9FIRM|nr:hypothetical protein CLOSTASPAR_00030 [[Clostridium] asparagiforme DSM 15981]